MELADYLKTNPEGYRLDADGTIRSPGKFEGQGLEVPYFYGLGLEGFADIDTGRVWGFNLTESDRATLETQETYLYLEETDSGFVNSDYGSNPDTDIVQEDSEEAF